MAHKIEPSPTGRASCRGCKQGIEKGALRFAEEFRNLYSNEGGLSLRYWHLPCAATKLANEFAATLAAFEGPIDDRASLEALARAHARPEMPFAERAESGRARCRACDTPLKKGELRVAFERVFESRVARSCGSTLPHSGEQPSRGGRPGRGAAAAGVARPATPGRLGAVAGSAAAVGEA